MSRPIIINGNTFSSASAPPSEHARFTDYLYIKGRGAINAEQKRQLASIGVTIFEYLGQNTYLCRYEPTDLQPIRDLSFIEQANVYPRRLKTSAFLEEAIQASERDSNSSASLDYKISVILHKDKDATDEFVESLIHENSLDRETLSVHHDRIILTASAEAISNIGQLDAVKAIEEVVEKTICNNFARQDLELLDADISGIDNKYQGEGQVIAIADTGFDLGSVTDIHPAFKDRVLALISEGRKEMSGKTNDFHGHGTHVAGSVLGDGESSTMGGKIQGTAPKATLVLQSLLAEPTLQPDNSRTPKLVTPPNLWDLFQTPYKTLNARIASNSWGPDWKKSGYRQIQYNSDAGAIDRFVWHNQDHVILFSAGNSGAEPSRTHAQIGGSSSAKNCICVGATGSSRGATNFAFDPAKRTGEPMSVASFSSRGPTLEGRVKPDVVAPGVAILSAASRDAMIDDMQRNRYGPTKDNLWMFSSGTSMATPLVAGCCAVIREVLQASGIQKPSAALIKALVINGAVDLGLERDQQGFGRVNLKKSLVPIEEQKGRLNGFADIGYASGSKLEEGQNWTHEIYLDEAASSGILKVTLAYSDRYGPALQNNLSLRVQIKLPSGSIISKKGDEDFLIENNMEQVASQIPSGSTAVITVTADRIARLDDSQAFAVVWAITQ